MVLRRLLACAMVAAAAMPALGQEIPDAPAVGQRDYTDVWPGYVVIPWSYKTPPLNAATAAAYKIQSIRAVHLDKGFTADQLAWADRFGFRFYVDHTAGKGYLFLREQKEIRGRRPAAKYVAPNGLIIRPNCLHDPKTLVAMEDLVRRHVTAAARHGVICYALDDEISTGSFVSPVETCWAGPCRPMFREFALSLYRGDLAALNRAWGTKFAAADQIAPASAGEAAAQAAAAPIDQWNFARWADFRQFMDQTLAETVADLVELANTIDPKRPCGFEGGQQPSAWGGYDWSRLARSVQWVEAYDLGGNDEIVRSLAPRVVRMKTYNASGPRLSNVWRLWYHFAHGDRGVIIWPETRDGPWWNEKAELQKPLSYLPPIFKELQSDKLAGLLAGAEFLDDGIAVYYSQPSIRAGWVLDATVHGQTWPNRSGTIDRVAGTPILARYAWLAMLEDAGLQYSFIDAAKLADGQLKFPRVKVLILPGAMALGDAEADAIKSFAAAGGTVIADYLPGVLDEHCRSRLTADAAGRRGAGALDTLFGVTHDPAAGLYDGRHVTFVNGEAYGKPFAERFFTDGVRLANGWPIVERAGDQSGAMKPHAFGRGRGVLMNLCPIPYLSARWAGKADANARRLVETIRDGGVEPAVRVRTAGAMTELIRWRKGGQVIACVVKNPKDYFRTWDTIAPAAGISDKPARLALEFESRPGSAVVNVRTGKTVDVIEGEDGVWRAADEWTPCEAAVYVWREKR